MKNRTLRSMLLLLAFPLFCPFFSFGWGQAGHKLVVQTALTLLKPATKQKVMAILNGYPADNAAIWMDSVRRKVPRYDYMNEWHFVNMDQGQPYEKVQSKSDVVYNLQRVINAMVSHARVSNDSMLLNVKILFHLMGDITQPLHCGYGSDLGGNKVMVTTPRFDNGNNNLHHVWDDVILQEGNISQQTCMTCYHKFTPAQIKAITSGDTKAWLAQSRSYLTKNVYTFQLKKNDVCPLSLQYLDNNVPIVQQQIVYAAVRLADVLEKAFGS